MAQSSSGKNQNLSSGGNRKSGNNRSRSGGGRSRSSRRGGHRRPKPKLTPWKKFIRAITFGSVDPTKKSKKKSSQRSQERRRSTRPPQEIKPTTPRLYVGNLNYDVDNDALKKPFARMGTVIEATVVMHSRSGKSKGFGFVEMSSLEEAKAAVSKLNNTDLMGRKLRVTGAKSERRNEGDSGDSKPHHTSGQLRSEGQGRSEGRGEGRQKRSSRDRRGGRGPSGDKLEKTSRQVKSVQIEQVSSPYLAISNLNGEALEEDLADLFVGIGSVKLSETISAGELADTKVLRVEMESTAEAQKAVEFLDGKSFMGNQLKVNGSEAFGNEAKVVSVEEKTPAEEPIAEEVPAGLSAAQGAEPEMVEIEPLSPDISGTQETNDSCPSADEPKES